MSEKQPFKDSTFTQHKKVSAQIMYKCTSRLCMFFSWSLYISGSLTFGHLKFWMVGSSDQIHNLGTFDIIWHHLTWNPWHIRNSTRATKRHLPFKQRIFLLENQKSSTKQEIPTKKAVPVNPNTFQQHSFILWMKFSYIFMKLIVFFWESFNPILYLGGVDFLTMNQTHPRQFRPFFGALCFAEWCGAQHFGPPQYVDGGLAWARHSQSRRGINLRYITYDLYIRDIYIFTVHNYNG